MFVLVVCNSTQQSRCHTETRLSLVHKASRRTVENQNTAGPQQGPGEHSVSYDVTRFVAAIHIDDLRRQAPSGLAKNT